MASNLEKNPWAALRQHTMARIALGRAGGSLPTAEVLRFGLAHALARDAVHLALSVDETERGLQSRKLSSLRVHSQAIDRRTFLLRPDLGRRLNEASAALLSGTGTGGQDVAFVLADGLSAPAIQRHSLPLLDLILAMLQNEYSVAPIVIAEQGRVALGDEIGERLHVSLVVMLIGERPGLSSPDSLGMYMTFGPRVGRNDAERNCISNVRPQGLSYEAAALRLVWLMRESMQRKLSGVALKDGSDILLGAMKPGQIA
jgi:ethanolamine ammonia-lyase small subunit